MSRVHSLVIAVGLALHAAYVPKSASHAGADNAVPSVPGYRAKAPFGGTSPPTLFERASRAVGVRSLNVMNVLSVRGCRYV